MKLVGLPTKAAGHAKTVSLRRLMEEQPDYASGLRPAAYA
jgi:hypothetical protein